MQPEFRINIEIGKNDNPGEASAWCFYVTKRSMFISRHPEAYEGQSGTIVPTFEEELQGRQMLIETCEENVKNGKPLVSQYLKDLVRIHQAGYLQEHVWWHLGQPSWKADQQPPNLLSFMAWARTNLRQHKAETRGRIQIIRQKAGNESGSKDGSAQADIGRRMDVQLAGGAELHGTVEEISSAIHQGDIQKAWSLLQKVSSAAIQLLKEADAGYVCVQSQRPGPMLDAL